MIEVSDTTLKYDSEKKLGAYERAGIPEYWIVDVPDACLGIPVEWSRQIRGNGGL